MPIMDVFNQDAFTAVSLTAAVDKFGFVPGLLGSIPRASSCTGSGAHQGRCGSKPAPTRPR